MGRYRNTLSHRIGPVAEDGTILKIAPGETYEATGELEKQVKAMPGQEPVKQKQSKGKGKGKGGSENPPADAGEEGQAGDEGDAD